MINALWKALMWLLHPSCANYYFFITSTESDLQYPDAKVITDTVHFGFNLNEVGVGKREGKYHNMEKNS